MKNLILIAALLTGCDAMFHQESVYDAAMVTENFDGCQYVHMQGNYALTHKGNCSNPIHKK